MSALARIDPAPLAPAAETPLTRDDAAALLTLLNGSPRHPAAEAYRHAARMARELSRRKWAAGENEHHTARTLEEFAVMLTMQAQEVDEQHWFKPDPGEAGPAPSAPSALNSEVSP